MFLSLNPRHSEYKTVAISRSRISMGCNKCRDSASDMSLLQVRSFWFLYV
jgi:hypothetical protein